MGDWKAEDLTQHITALPATQQPRERIMSTDEGGGIILERWSGEALQSLLNFQRKPSCSLCLETLMSFPAELNRLISMTAA